MADFGFFDEEVLGESQSQTNKKTKTPEKLAMMPALAVPNAISPKKELPATKSKRVMEKLQLQEVYDMAKIFNGPE